MDVRPVCTNLSGIPIDGTGWNRLIRQSFRLRNQGNHIHTETVDSLLTPTVHHIENFFPHSLIFPVEIRLLLRKKMQIKLSCFLRESPGRTGEERTPVVRWKELLSLILHYIGSKVLLLFGRNFTKLSSLLPDIVIPLLIFRIFSGLKKPHVLITRVIHHKIHHNLQSLLMRALQ